VMFFSSRKSRKITSILDAKNRIRGFLLDTQVPNAHEISIQLGCSLISDELAEHEEAESDKRVERISYLFPNLMTYSALFTEAYLSSILDTADEFPKELKPLLDKLITQAKSVLEEGVSSALTGALAQLVDLDLVEIPRKVR
jgi:hypothetical protein